MTIPYEKTAAIVVLPAAGAGRLQDSALRRWLARSEIRQRGEPRELLARILDVLNLPYPQSGLGALRMWGQTGERPSVWIAAADPVYLEPPICAYSSITCRRCSVTTRITDLPGWVRVDTCARASRLRQARFRRTS